MWGHIRWEHDRLTDHLARGAGWDIDGIATSARSTSHKWGVPRRCPASMANSALVHAGVCCIRGVACDHSEALSPCQHKAIPNLRVFAYFLECRGLSAWDIINVEATFVL